jgi:hypothetical protein
MKPVKERVTAKRDEHAREYYDNYAEYNRTLRAWFVIFGVGGPATFIASKELSAKLVETGALTTIAALFLIGAGAQLLIAFTNKTASWCCYFGEIDKPFRGGSIYRAMRWINNQYWLDFVMDLTTFVTFAAAIWQLFVVFGAA